MWEDKISEVKLILISETNLSSEAKRTGNLSHGDESQRSLKMMSEKGKRFVRRRLNYSREKM